MTLLGLTLTQLATIFGAIGGAVTLLYILKLRRRRVAVPFAQLWQRVLKERQSDSLFHRLKRLLSLLLQLAFLFFLVAALGNPRLSTQVLSERRIILLVDASASMKATDGDGNFGGGGTRLETALRRAREIVRGLSGSDSMMIVRMDAQVTPLTSFTGDEKTLLKALDKLEATDTRADIGRALKFCADALRGRKSPMLIVVGDGAYDEHVLARVSVDARSGALAKTKPKAVVSTSQPATSQPAATAAGSTSKPATKTTGSATKPANRQPAAKTASANKPKKALDKRLVGDLDRIDLSGVQVRFLPVGKSRDNVGIVAFNARRYPTNKLSFEIFLEIVSYRKKTTEVDLQLLSDGAINDVKRLVLKPGERMRYTCSPSDRKQGKKSWCDMAASGELLEARLVRPGSDGSSKGLALDAFPLDDRAYALLPPRRKMKVMLVSSGNLFLEGALLLDENIDLTRIRADQYSERKLRGLDAVVFDSWYPPKPPSIHSLLVNPPQPEKDTPNAVPFKVLGQIERPYITEQSTSHPVMRFVTLKDVNISTSAKFARGKQDVVLAASLRDPVLIARDDGKTKQVAFGFDPKRSDLPLRIAFPLLVINTINWFSGEGQGLVTTYKAGSAWQVPLNPPAEGAPVRDFVKVKNPVNEELRAPVTGSYAVLHGRHVGIYEIQDGSQKLRIAANLADPEESNIAPRRELVLGGRLLSPPAGFSVKLRREIWIYLLLFGLGLILLEWLTYNRRLTV